MAGILETEDVEVKLVAFRQFFIAEAPERADGARICCACVGR
jgi:hypothetical protein